MAIINSYAAGTPTTSDLILGVDTSNSKNTTKTFTAGEIAMAIIYSYPKTAPLAADLLIVSRQPSDPDETANYSVSVSDIATLVTGLQQYTLKAGTKAGTSVPLTLDSDTGTDSTVNFTEGGIMVRAVMAIL
jgi:hypothetical protein